MRTIRSFLMVALVALALSGFTFNQAYAECTGRVSINNAECLNSSVTLSSPRYRVTTYQWSVWNECSDYGTVEALVLGGADDANGDLNVTLSTSNKTTRTASDQPRGYICCKDQGDLCNRSDVATAANCTSKFDAGDAADSCEMTRMHDVTSDYECRFNAICGTNTHVNVKIAFTSMDDLKYCTDEFSTADSCP